MQWEKELLNGPSHRKWFFCSRARERPFSKKKRKSLFCFPTKESTMKMQWTRNSDQATANWQRFFHPNPCARVQWFRQNSTVFIVAVEQFVESKRYGKFSIHSRNFAVNNCDSKVISCPRTRINYFPSFMRTSFSWQMNLLKVKHCFSSMLPFWVKWTLCLH